MTEKLYEKEVSGNSVYFLISLSVNLKVSNKAHYFENKKLKRYVNGSLDKRARTYTHQSTQLQLQHS